MNSHPLAAADASRSRTGGGGEGSDRKSDIDNGSCVCLCEARQLLSRSPAMDRMHASPVCLWPLSHPPGRFGGYARMVTSCSAFSRISRTNGFLEKTLLRS